MNAEQILNGLRHDGITLTLLPPDQLKLDGKKKAISKWLSSVKEHKPELLALLAANEDNSDSLTDMAIDEAVKERAAIMEYDGGLSRTQADYVAKLFKAFYCHLMGPGKVNNCCYAPSNKYCAEGLRLRDEYYKACS